MPYTHTSTPLWFEFDFSCTISIDGDMLDVFSTSYFSNFFGWWFYLHQTNTAEVSSNPTVTPNNQFFFDLQILYGYMQHRCAILIFMRKNVNNYYGFDSGCELNEMLVAERCAETWMRRFLHTYTQFLLFLWFDGQCEGLLCSRCRANGINAFSYGYLFIK